MNNDNDEKHCTGLIEYKEQTKTQTVHSVYNN